MLYELCETAVGLTVSRYDELSILILGDDEMAAPVIAPFFERGGDTQPVNEGGK